MHLSLILLHLAGAVMLLLYAVQIVRMGVESAWGGQLRAMLRAAKTSDLRAALGGVTLATMLQSSTAVAILACGFATSGFLSVPTGLALMLGADLGSALVARILSIDLGWLVPAFLFVGGLLHLKVSSPLLQEIGRMVLGIGLILLSLTLIGSATGPLRESALPANVSDYLAEDYLTAFLIGALFTWLIHSGVAFVLMLAAFATHGLLTLDAAIPMILGCNLGGGMIAFWLTRGMATDAQRITTGNLLFRSGAAIAALAVFEATDAGIETLGSTSATAVVNFHLAFNLGLVAIGLPFVGAVARLTGRMHPGSDDPSADAEPWRTPSALDPSVIDTPRLALASATRELLRMGELIEAMARPVMSLMEDGDRDAIARTRKIDAEVNRIHTRIKLYLAQVNRGQLSEDEARRSIELTDFAINLEHAGDIVAKHLLALADKKVRTEWQFSPAGWAELTELHQKLMDNIHLSLNVLVSQDHPSARQLVREKQRMRDMARRTQDLHLKRLQDGTPESIETSGMHLEIARGFKEMNSLLVTVAYPLLARSGELLDSRLSQDQAAS
ncbi:Na/Pi cotransporter family protein [Paracoccus sp. TK19116]|uniref:Na/Pi cotransporter family protein n=1 Tax=Paracoccus albicereus TaxID=2922394 RepID=A0ABT1MMY9_9RHOB|nr:Na/Pi cotransporter family protein [Paracoccus albicereus]